MPTVQSASFIEYGRRFGKYRKNLFRSDKKWLALPSEKDDTEAKMRAKLRKERVLTPEEWTRVQHNLYARKREIERRKQEKLAREQLHDESKRTVKLWPNTIEGDRQLKKISRKLREEADEEYRQEVDLAEKRYQAEKRREAIEKAKSDQYFESDRLKAFRGALSLTEVLIERDEQVKMKNNQDDYLRDREIELNEMVANEHRRGMLEEQLKKKEKFDKCKAVKDFELIQAAEKKELEKKEKIDGLLEKQRVQQYGEFCQWESEKLEKIKIAEKGIIKQTLLEQIKNKAEIEKLEKQLLEEENNEIRAFADAKRKIAGMRRLREKELQDKAINLRMNMVKKLSIDYQKDAQKAYKAMMKAIEERDAKKIAEEEALQRKRKKEIMEINEYRKEQMKFREQEEEKERCLDKEHYLKRIQADTLFLEKRESYLNNKKNNRRKLHDYHLAQTNQKAEAERLERENDYRSDKCLAHLLELEQKQLENYAKEVTDRLNKQGYNSYPIRKVAAEGIGGGRGPRQQRIFGMRPSYQSIDLNGEELPCYKRNLTDRVRMIRDPMDVNISKKRLGFIWS